MRAPAEWSLLEGVKTTNKFYGEQKNKSSSQKTDSIEFLDWHRDSKTNPDPVWDPKTLEAIFMIAQFPSFPQNKNYQAQSSQKLL